MRRLLLVPVLLCLPLLAACGSSPSSTAKTTTTSASSSGSSGSALPAVANATDLGKEPVISAGTPPPPSKLETKDLVVGTGTEAKPTSTVVVQYVGADYTNGKDFDSSWERDQPATFPLDGVVRGFEEGIVGMKVGGRREIVIPPSLGYGAQGQPPAVGRNETLVFVVDLKGVTSTPAST